MDSRDEHRILPAGPRIRLRRDDVHFDARAPLSLANAVFRLRGPLDVDALRRAVELLSRRHEALRTCFDDRDGARLVVFPDARLTLREIGARGDSPAERAAWASGWISREIGVPLDDGLPPRLRATLVRVDDDDHFLVLVIDHAVADGWSMSVLARDIGDGYEQQVRGGPPADRSAGRFSSWLRDETAALAGDRGRELVDFWGALLGPDPDVIRWRFRDIRPVEEGGYVGDSMTLTLGPSTVAELKSVARTHRATLFSLMSVVLLRTVRPFADNEVACLMTTVANRFHEDAEDMVGNCVNTVWVPSRGEDGDLAGAVGAFSDTLRSVLAHQDAPERWLLEQLYPGVYKGFPDVPQVYFLYAQAWDSPLRLPDIQVDGVEWDEETAQPGLQFYATERDGRIELRVHWRRGEFAESVVREIAERYVLALRETG